MVFIPPCGRVPQLTAYLTANLSRTTLDDIHQRFERGACSRFNPSVELFITPAPANALHEILRSNTHKAPFLVIDENTPQDKAVWYVQGFATPDDVADGDVQNTNVVWRIRMKIECVPETFINYEFAGMSMAEDLLNCGVDFPLTESFTQPRIWDVGGGWSAYNQSVWVTADADEVQYNDNGTARLKDHIAKENGLLNNWTKPLPPKPIKLSNGQIHRFSPTSVVLQLRFNPDHPWPPYKRLEGSL